MPSGVDLVAHSQGSTWVFRPLNPRAKNWLVERVEHELWQWVGAALVVDWRYGRDLLDSARYDGLTTEKQ